MDFLIDVMSIPDHTPKKTQETPLDNQGSFREGLLHFTPFVCRAILKQIHSCTAGASNALRRLAVAQVTDLLLFVQPRPEPLANVLS